PAPGIPPLSLRGALPFLDSLGAPATIRVMNADQLAIATFDHRQIQCGSGLVQLEQFERRALLFRIPGFTRALGIATAHAGPEARSEEHTSVLQSRAKLVC